MEPQQNVAGHKRGRAKGDGEAASASLYDKAKQLVSAMESRDKVTAVALSREKGVLEAALFHAIEYWKPTLLIEALLKAGANIHALNEKGLSPLWQAWSTRQVETIECLVKHGANVASCRNINTGHHLLFEIYSFDPKDPPLIFKQLWQPFENYTLEQIADMVSFLDHAKALAKYNERLKDAKSHSTIASLTPADNSAGSASRLSVASASPYPDPHRADKPKIAAIKKSYAAAMSGATTVLPREWGDPAYFKQIAKQALAGKAPKPKPAPAAPITLISRSVCADTSGSKPPSNEQIAALAAVIAPHLRLLCAPPESKDTAAERPVSPSAFLN